MGPHDPKFKAWLKSELRRAYQRMPDSKAKKAFLEARVSYGKYRCAHCLELFGPTQVKRDHIEPVDPITGWKDWSDHISRLYFGDIQILCKDCHDSKSKIENAARRKTKNNAKS